jgi:hypothetical protein
MRWLLIILAAVVAAVGCGINPELCYEPAPAPPRFNSDLGLFSRSSFPPDKVMRRDIDTNIPFPKILDVKYVYLNAGFSRNYSTNYCMESLPPHNKKKFIFEYTKEALEKIGFKAVLDEKGIAHRMIENGMSNQVKDSPDMDGLRDLSVRTGPSLIIEAYLSTSGTDHSFRLKIVDPVSEEDLLSISKTWTSVPMIYTNDWSDLESKLLFPVLNIAKEWHETSVKKTDNRESS